MRKPLLVRLRAIRREHAHARENVGCHGRVDIKPTCDKRHGTQS